MAYEPGMTIQDVLDKRKYTFRMITVIVNGQVIPKNEYSSYEVKDNDNIDVMHIMSGGQLKTSPQQRGDVLDIEIKTKGNLSI